MASESLSIFASPQDDGSPSQSAASMIFQPPKNTESSNLQTIKGVKINRTPETFQSVLSYLRSCGLNVSRMIYEKGSFVEDRVILLICQSVYGDDLAVIPPENFNTKGGDLAVREDRKGVKYVPDATSQYYLEKVPKDYPNGFLFVCNTGLQHFPPGKTESDSFLYEDHEDAKAYLKVEKHFYRLMPSIEFSNLMPIDRLNTLQVALEQLIKNEEAEEVYKAFAQAMLDSQLAPLLSSEAELTLLVPPSLPEDADLITLASHVIMGSHAYRREDGQTISLKSYTKTGTQVMINYEEGVMQSIEIDEDRIIPVDGNRTSISKYNGVILGLSETMPRLEPKEGIPENETSDLGEVFTLFDLSRLSLTIEIVRKKLDVQDQNELLKTVSNLNSLTEEIVLKAHTTMKEHFQSYVPRMMDIQQKFYAKDIPCVEPVCEDYYRAEEDTKQANLQFKRGLDASGKLRFVLKELELLMLSLYAIQQDLEVDNPRSEMGGLEDEED